MKLEILKSWATTGPSLEELLPLSIYDFKNEADLLKSIDKLHFHLTESRESIEDLYQDPKLVAAYFLFYFATHIGKLDLYWSRLKIETQIYLSSLDWVDFGSGPGTFAWALLSKSGDQKSKYYLVERSSLMRIQAEKVRDFLGFQSQVEIVDNLSKLKLSRPTGIFFGHSYNEGIEGEARFLSHYPWSAVVLLEPGNKESFKQLLTLRSILHAKSYEVDYPCSSKAACPMDLEGNEDWCHQFARLSFPADIERLSQILKINRRDAANIFHVYLPDTLKSSTSSLPRPIIVGGVWPEKGKYEWLNCEVTSEGENKLIPRRILRRNLTTQEEKKIRNLFPGDSFEIADEKKGP
ncbi:MAG: small ribosomal subunit Rsm22 family protein [Bacteriovoracaceae bacterium]|nr:small ribosomal subunit Rsm22 family protein [Bacteriovoracaceae bacterium]